MNRELGWRLSCLILAMYVTFVLEMGRSRH
jgi:hypothetical protein